MDMSALAGFTAALERALNRYLELDPDSRARLAALRGGVVALAIEGTGHTLYFVPGEDHIQVTLHYDRPPDTLIRGAPLSLARLGLAGDTTRLPDGVSLEGDARLGQNFRDLLRGVDLDLEEWLSRVTGDMFAHRVGDSLRAFAGWARHAADSLRMNAGEYLREESGVMPTQDEVNAFMDDVDRLREDIDRLEARIRRLEPGAGARSS
jgi:ubiquinone biosynthesis accessory factor UbiJ